MPLVTAMGPPTSHFFNSTSTHQTMKQVTRRQLFSALGGALLAPYALAQQASKPGLVLAGAKEATTRLVLLGT